MSKGKNQSQYSMDVSKSARNGLTVYRGYIHCPATQELVEAEGDELYDIAIEHFLETLAQVALSIAARESAKKQKRDG